MKIETATLDWKADDNGNLVPVSQDFGDVYYSLVDGLAESKYVFLEGNKLPQRLTRMHNKTIADRNYSGDGDGDNRLKHRVTQVPVKNTFTIAELGFGTGLNFFATWQLWRELRQQYPHLANQQLHFMSFEKFPLTKADFIQSLLPWQQRDTDIAQLVDEFVSVYPTLVAGCHRLNFTDDNLTLDLWLGDAVENMQHLALSAESTQPALLGVNRESQCHHLSSQRGVDAWFLDGFAPSCNESLWVDAIFSQIQRLSAPDATAATFSCAGVVKRGFKDVGFAIKKVKGFGRKREMLVAQYGVTEYVAFDTVTEELEWYSEEASQLNNCDKQPSNNQGQKSQDQKYQEQPECCEQDSQLHDYVVIGAGVTGLMTAWMLAQKGQSVTIIDKGSPMSGASGNPRALLAPKMTPINHVDNHLHSIGYLYSARLYRQLNNLVDSSDNSLITPVFEETTALDFMNKANIDTDQIGEYPQDFAQVLDSDSAHAKTGIREHDFSSNQYLPQAGLVNPQALADIVLSHDNIHFVPFTVETLVSEYDKPVMGLGEQNLCSDYAYENNAGYIRIQESKDEESESESSELKAKNVIICSAYESHELDKRIFDFRKIGGQLSWFEPTNEQGERLPKIPLKFGGYCSPFVAKSGDEQLNSLTVGKQYVLMGASFIRNTTNTDVVVAEHQHNLDKITTAIPELQTVLDECDIANWHGRVGVRSQTPDYHPVVGQIDKGLWTLSGMGAKGYAYAPICAEIMTDLMLGRIPPLSQQLLVRLNPYRDILLKPLKP